MRLAQAFTDTLATWAQDKVTVTAMANANEWNGYEADVTLTRTLQTAVGTWSGQ